MHKILNKFGKDFEPIKGEHPWSEDIPKGMQQPPMQPLIKGGTEDAPLGPYTTIKPETINGKSIE